MREPAPTGTRRILHLLAPFFAFALCLGPPAAGFAATADEVRALVRQALSDPDIQRELPLAGPDKATATREAARAEPSEADDRRIRSRYGTAADRTERRKDAEPGPDRSFRFEFSLGDEETGLALLGVLALAGLAWAAHRLLRAYRARNPDRLPGRSSDPNGEYPEPEPAGAEAEPESKPARLEPPELAEADRLAGNGAFGEAVGVILRHAIERLRGTHHVNLPPSLTSREVRQQVRLDDLGSEALDRLVTVTELSRFAGRPASESDFRACREHFLHHLAHTAGNPSR